MAKLNMGPMDLDLPAHLANTDLADLTRDQLLEILELNSESGIRINFAGKSGARRLARLVQPRVTRNVPKLGHGTADERSNNLLIEGDNLQSMVTLYRERGQVDLIVTDPPYNTGNDFRYNDRWDDDPNDPGMGEFVSADDGARHTKWMRFMWPRLQMMKSMLKPGGVLAICIDHREMFRLGQMLDELFDEKNRLAIINWQRSYTPSNDADHVATTTEYVLVYAKTAAKAKTRLLPRGDADGETVNLDADEEPWTDAPATGSNAKAHKSMVYGIQSPFTGKVLYPPPGSAWRQGQDRNLEQIQGWGSKYKLVTLDDADTRAELIGVPVEDVPAVKAIMLAEPLPRAQKKANKILESGSWPRFYFLARGKGRPRLKKYLYELQAGFVPTTYWATDQIDDPTVQPVLPSESWPHGVSGHSQQGVRELTDIVGAGHEFKTVKPLKLITKIIQIWCPTDGLVLDPFAGSGTTGHAVLQMNQQDEGERRFVLIEQGRPERGDSYAQTLTADRLQRVCTGDWSSGAREPLGSGFTFVKLGKKVDAAALLRMEREEMLDTVIGSHFDANRRRGDQLVRIEGKPAYRYLIARNSDHEGFFLVWEGPDKNTDLTEEVYEAIAAEGERAGVRPVPYHTYARLYRYQTDGVRFYQIPDRILSDFGLDMRNEPFTSEDDDET
jgi:adenine-specific DNA-methyltransferase